ncbi:unnamed protein product [Rhodiola kirilowii]
MLEESLWGVMSSWFTPTMLFVYLNFMIATIFVTSGFGSHKQQQQPHRLYNIDLQQQENQTESFLQRSPYVLQRLKSINFYQCTRRIKEDEEVDSKADDFINKFKQQLKLQRLDSILRYKEMLGRGVAK